MFKPNQIRWSEELSKAARDYMNEAAPCNLPKPGSGESIVNIFNRYILNYHDMEIVTFKGLDKKDGKELIDTMLAHQNFEEDVKGAAFDELGVGCACNSQYGIECMMIFGQGVLPKNLQVDSEWMWKMSKTQCGANCN